MTDIPVKISFAARLRNSFLTGVLILAPVTITMWLIWSFLQWADSWVKPYIPARYDPEQYFDVAIPGFGLLIAVIGITLIGFLGNNLIGKWIVGVGESVLNRMPLVRPIYKSIKQLFESVLKEHSNSFKKVGLIEFPSPGTGDGIRILGGHGELAHRFNEMGQRWLPSSCHRPGADGGFPAVRAEGQDRDAGHDTGRRGETADIRWHGGSGFHAAENDCAGLSVTGGR